VETLIIYIKLIGLILLAIIIPPLAVFFCSFPIREKLNQVVINFFLWICFLIPGVVHALVVVSRYETAQCGATNTTDQML